MKILIINWRSLRDPAAGGAELVTYEHARRWISKYQAQVIWLSPKYNNAIDRETISGINFRYIGIPLGLNFSRLIFSYPIYFILVFWNYLTKYKNEVDVVVEGIHGIPLLTSLYVKKTLIVYLQEVAGEIWNKMFPFPINIIGQKLEKSFINMYRHHIFVVGSNSAKLDLINVGIMCKQIFIVNHGVSLPPLSRVPKKSQKFSLIFLNRLVKMKGAERAIRVFSLIEKKYPDSELLMVGKSGNDYLTNLKTLVAGLGLAGKVSFLGFVDEPTKIRLLKNSHLLINLSYKEGWGLVNIEANTQGTPVVAFDVEGNRDSIKTGINGYLIRDGDINEMARTIIKLRGNVSLRKTSLSFSRNFSWEIQSDRFYRIIQKTVGEFN